MCVVVSQTDGRRRVGVFGGTFDPPHMAHVLLAAEAVHQLDLDELIVTVAGVPWQKVGERQISPPEVRLAMCRSAFAPVERAHVSDIEIRRSGDSYTVDTLVALSEPQTTLFLLLGEDAAAGLDSWRRPHDVASLATIAVFPRRGHRQNALRAAVPKGFEAVDLELVGLEVSSTDIRRRVGAGEPIDGLVPASVKSLVAQHELYSGAAGESGR